MPAVSERQRRFFGAELARKRAGKRTQTGLSQRSLRDFARKPISRLPEGAAQSPKGDLGDQRGREGMKVGLQKFRGAGRHEKAASELPNRITQAEMGLDTQFGPKEVVV